ATPTAGLKSGDIITLTVRIQDHFANPLTGLTSHITLAHNQAGTVTWVDHQDGTYSAPLTLTKLGDDPLKATVQNVDSQSMAIIVEPQQSKTSVNTVELHTLHPLVSVGQAATLTLTLLDKHNNGVVQIPSNEIKLENNKLTLSNIQWQEQGDGVYTTELPFSQIGNQKLISTVNFIESQSVDVDVTALKGATRVHRVTLDATPKQLVVGESTQLTLTLLDQFNNGVLDVLESDININDDNTRSTLTGLQWQYQQNGVYTANALITKGGVHSLKATVNNKQDNVLIHAISSVGQSYVNDAVLTSNTMNIIAGNSTTLMLKLKDQHGNPVSQVASSDITLTDSSGATIQTHWNEMNNLGDYHASIQLDIVGSHTLAVTTNNIARNIQIQVTAAQGASSVAQLEIAPIATTEAGEKTSIAVTMKDQYGNIVNNVLNRDITIEIGGITYPIQLTELSDTGQYTGQIPAQPQGQHAVKITVNTHSKTTNWNVNNPTTIPLSSFDKTGQRGALETATLSHNKNLVGSGDKVTFTLTLMDKFDNPLTGASPQLRLLTNLSEVSLWQDNRDGSYSIELLMNRLGSQNVQAIVKNMLSNDINLNIAALSGANNVDTTALTIRDATIEAGNTTQLTLLLKDSVDNGVTQVQNGDIHLTQNSVKTDKLWSSVIDGIYTTPIQINKVGIYPLRATVNKQNSRIETLEVTHPHGQAKVANAQLVSNIASLDAGKDVELTLTLKDQYDNLVIGINGADIALKDSHTTEVIDNSRIAWHMASEGIYKASLPLTLIGNHMLTATVNHQSASTSQITINPLKGTANVNQIMLTAAQNAISAGETTMLTLSVLDSFGNEVSDVLTSDISLTNADAQITTLATWTKVPSTVGTYAASVQLDKVMAHTLIAKVNGQTKTTQIHVNPLKNFDNVTTVSLQTPSTTEVDEKNKLTLTLTDRFGNGVVDVDPRHISLTLGSVAQVVTWIEDQNGTYHTELALSQVGNQSITVKVNNATETKAVRVNSPAGKDKVVSIQFATTTTSVLPNESVTLTLTLKDQHGNSVKNVRSSDISLSDSHIPESFTSPNWAEDSQQIGVYTAVVNLKKTAEHTLTAKVNNLEKGTKITVQPFTGVQQVNIVELSVDKKEISIGGKVNFTLTAKDIYGNNVSIQTADIRLQNANDAINQPTWQQQGLQFKGELTLSTSGSYVITAKVGDKTSSPTNLTVQSGKPVFAAGKSEFSVSSHEIDEGSNANITVKLVLKDASGNPILGKRPRVSASAGTIANTMQENNYGVYTSTFKNNAIGKSNLTLDSASIDYNDTVPPITVITYGSSKIIAQSHSFSMSDEFPNTGFKGAKFQITVPIGQQTDYDWSVDIDWLSIDDKGVVTMRHKPIPIRNGNAMIPIFKGVPKPHTGYKRTVDYRFTLKKWYDSHGKMGAFASRNTCIAPSRLIKYNDLSIGRSYSRQVGEQVFQEWGAKFTQDHLGINSFFWTADTQTNTKNSIYNPFTGVDKPIDISNSQSLDAICVDDLN
ncbi:hypothetical protein, partial [Providencia vermicola]|uniref:hypothetical protein n=1 Tax=Providencia vermicola TaxID=333965 RepID=UPI003D293688